MRKSILLINEPAFLCHVRDYHEFSYICDNLQGLTNKSWDYEELNFDEDEEFDKEQHGIIKKLEKNDIFIFDPHWAIVHVDKFKIWKDFGTLKQDLKQFFDLPIIYWEG